MTAAPAAAQPSPAQLEPVTIQLKWKHEFQFAGYYAAKYKGFFAEEGLDVTLRPRADGMDYVEEVTAGRAEYGTGDAGLLISRAQGKPVVILKQIFQHSPLIFIAKKGSGILSPYEMIGKTVRFDPQSGAFSSLTATLIETIQDPSRVVAVPQSYDLESFKRGEVDVISAYLTSQPYVLRKMGIEITEINPLNYGVDFYGDNLFTTDNEVQAHPERVRKMIRASVRGWLYALQHKEEIVDLIRTRYAPDEERDALLFEAEATERMILPDVVLLGHINPMRFQHIADVFSRVGLIGRPIVPEGLFYRDPSSSEVANDGTRVRKHPVIRAGFIPTEPPLAFVDDEGRPQGIVVDYMKVLEQYCGASFELIPGEGQELMAKVSAGQIDMIANDDNTLHGDESSLLHTGPYVKLEYGIFADEDTKFISSFDMLDGHDVSVVRNSRAEQLLAVGYPSIRLIHVAEIRDGLNRVRAGDAIAFIGNLLTTEQVIQSQGGREVALVGQAPFTNSLLISVVPDSSALQSFLQTGIGKITQHDRNAILDKWAPLVHMKPASYKWIRYIMGGLVVLVLLFLVWNRRLADEVAKRTATLAKSEELFRKLFEEHSAVKFIIDPETNAIIDANKAAAEFYGWSREELRQMHVWDINILSEEEIRQESARSKSNGRKFREFRHRRADGSIRDVAVAYGNIEYRGRSLIHSIVNDITEAKSLEEQLRHAQKMEAVGSLAGGVAHDFNNMLGVIIGHTGMVLENPELSESTKMSLQEVFDAAQRSADIARQLLTFARQQTIQPEAVDLNSAVDRMLKILKRLIGENIELIWKPGSDVWPVWIDPSQVDQILINLVVNARDAIGGVGNITIETQNVSSASGCRNDDQDLTDGDCVCLKVSDDGCGIPRDAIDRIFEPFFTTKDLAQGTGLGLATVHGIVEQNGGALRVDSEPGSGTEFEIYFPRDMSPASVSLKMEKEKESTMHKETILLVEDEPAILQLGKVILERQGYAVLTAGKPSEALAIAHARSEPIHLLITDVIMPEMSGRDLAKEIQGMHHGIRTLFMSGYTANILGQDDVQDDEFAFLQKPFTNHALTERVEAVLA